MIDEFLRAFAISLFIAFCFAIPFALNFQDFLHLFFQMALPIFCFGVPLHFLARHYNLTTEKVYLAGGALGGLCFSIFFMIYRHFLFGSDMSGEISAFIGMSTFSIIGSIIVSAFTGKTFWVFLVNKTAKEIREISVFWAFMVLPAMAIKMIFFIISIK